MIGEGRDTPGGDLHSTDCPLVDISYYYLVHKLFPSNVISVQLNREEGTLQQYAVNLKPGAFSFRFAHVKVETCFWCRRAKVIHMQHLSVSDPVYSNVNPLVCLTFQWCSGHFNSVCCGYAQRRGCACQGESQQLAAKQKKCEARSQKCRNYLNTSRAFLSTPSPLWQLLLRCTFGGDVSDPSPGRDAVSRQTAHQGEWQALGREPTTEGRKLHTVAPTINLCTWPTSLKGWWCKNWQVIIRKELWSSHSCSSTSGRHDSAG